MIGPRLKKRIMPLLVLRFRSSLANTSNVLAIFLEDTVCEWGHQLWEILDIGQPERRALLVDVAPRVREA